MKFLLNTEQAKKVDEFAIENLGIPSIVLMENAARSSADFISSIISNSDKILVLAGMGNNGGDGLAIARHLFNYSFRNLEIFLVGDISKITKDSLINYSILKKLDIPINIINESADIEKINNTYSVIIDSLIGIGGGTNLRGILPSLLEKVNKFDATKFAIDLPTGLDSNTGYTDKNVFKADYTITMFSPKLGLYINEGKHSSGKIFDAYLGVPDEVLKKFSNNYILDDIDLKQLAPQRKSESSKFDYGRILIIAGSEKYSGASALASNACIKAGAGLVELFSNQFHPSILPEIIQLKAKSNTYGCLSYDNINFLIEIIDKYDVITIGPGLSNENETIKLVNDIIYNNQSKKIIIDADGLKGIEIDKELGQNILLTPHIFEFINTFKLDKNKTLANPYTTVLEVANKYNCNILLKNVPTIITNGRECFLNVKGNSGMATAGSGDVLTGIVSYYASQMDNMLLAGALGAYIHSSAGDIYAHKYNKESLTASEIINHLKDINFV